MRMFFMPFFLCIYLSLSFFLSPPLPSPPSLFLSFTDRGEAIEKKIKGRAIPFTRGLFYVFKEVG